MVASFSTHRDELAQHLLHAARAYAEKKGLGALDQPALHQMSVSVEEISGEILMFGLDVWPIPVEEG
jgi:hypothetical protein